MDKKKTKILLVENGHDKYIMSRDLLSELIGRNYEIQRITSYQEALEAIGRNEHDICLLDYRLGEHTELEVLRDAINNGCRMPYADYNTDLPGRQRNGYGSYEGRGHRISC